MAPLSAQGALPLSSLAAKPGMNSELFAIFFFFFKAKILLGLPSASGNRY